MGALFSQLLTEATLSPDSSFKVFGAKLKGKDEREYLRSILEKIPGMKWVYVENCGVKAVPEAVDLLKELRGLVLPNNSIKLLPALSLTHLQHVNLSYNSFNAFPDSLLRCESVEHVDLSHNQLGSGSFGLSLGSLKQLRVLNLSHNPLSVFPSAILELKKLRDLRLAGCGLTALPAEWPPLLKKHLCRLDVSRNPLGTLVGVETLVHLEHLCAADTQLDTFPELGNLLKLLHLDLSHNRIVQLPLPLAKLDRLTVLRLNDNRILEIPKHIKSLTHLREMFVVFSCFTVPSSNDPQTSSRKSHPSSLQRPIRL